MNGAPPTIPKPRRHLSPPLVVCLASVCILAIPVALYVKWRVSNSRAVSRLEKAARSKGEPLNYSELSATYGKVAASDNAYVALEAVWASEDPEYWAAFSAGQRNLMKSRIEEIPRGIASLAGGRYKLRPSERLTAAQIQAATQFLQSQHEHMSRVREALKRKEFRALIAFEDGQGALLPYLAQLRREATMFLLEAYCAVEEGRIDHATDSISQIVLIGDHLRDDPFLIGQLVRLSAYHMAIKSIERLVSKEPLSASQLERLSEIAVKAGGLDGYKRAMIGERALFFGFLDAPERPFLLSQQPEDGESPEEKAQNSAFGMRLFGVLGLNAAEKRLTGEALEKIIARAGTQDFATNDEVADIMHNLLSQARQFPPKMMTLLLMPSLSACANRFAGAEALRLCTLEALRVELYRSQHGGDLPDQLETLRGDVPSDPFNGQPLHFKRTDSGYIIYSVGPDRKDNDGLLDPPTKSQGPGPRESDIGFRVERRATK